MNDIYPTLISQRPLAPNRYYAFPFFGFLAKVILLIPVFIDWFFLQVTVSILAIINSFVVLITGKFWNYFYNLAVGYFRFQVKIYFYLIGITDKYPGFSMNIQDNFSVDIPKPETPNRLFALPILGGFARGILIIPYFIFQSVVQNGAWIGTVISSFPVFFKGSYPESTYEFNHDSIRIALSTSSYFYGLSDKYPSFHINMNHRNIKIALLIAGALWALLSFFNSTSDYQNQIQQIQEVNISTS